MAINQLKKNGVLHSSTIIGISRLPTVHGVFIQDAVDFLKALPDSSVQLILIDPPYNLDLDKWDSFPNYLDWAKGEIYKKDKRLNPESIEKGKNPTNVWEVGRLNDNSTEKVGHLTQKPIV